MINKIKSHAKELKNDIIDVRRHLHQFPCLSFEEYETAQFIHALLDSWDIEHEFLTETGIVAIIKGRNPEKKTIALRADIDALPIQEKNDCTYKSRKQ